MQTAPWHHQAERKKTTGTIQREEMAKVDSGNVSFCQAADTVFYKDHVAYFRLLKDHKDVS